MRHFQKLAAALMVLLVMTGCTPAAPAATPAPASVPAPTIPSSSGYPASTPASAYPGNQPGPSVTMTAPTLVVPAPDQNTGVVTGQFVFQSTGAPMPNMGAYLGEKLPHTTGTGYSIIIKEKETPHSQTDINGRFAIAARPGEYVLIAWTPFNSKVVSSPNDPAQEYAITLKAGETIDVGKIQVVWP